MSFLDKKQTKELENKDWIVKPDGFYITIYSSDMNESDWEQICQQVECSPDSSEVTVLGFGYKNS